MCVSVTADKIFVKGSIYLLFIVYNAIGIRFSQDRNMSTLYKNDGVYFYVFLILHVFNHLTVNKRRRSKSTEFIYSINVHNTYIELTYISRW